VSGEFTYRHSHDPLFQHVVCHAAALSSCEGLCDQTQKMYDTCFELGFEAVVFLIKSKFV